MRVLVTGAAGFIGFHLCRALLQRGYEVTGIDNLNDYYNVNIKKARIADLILKGEQFQFHEFDLGNPLHTIGPEMNFDFVVHLGAQAGVRHSVDHPEAYVHSNLVGFNQIIEHVRQTRPINFVYASSSSVYGGEQQPFHVKQSCNNPASLYGATKKANEMVAKSYGNMFGIDSTGLRFFTVYGEHGRPDSFMYKVLEALTNGDELRLFRNEGDKIKRDFTHVDDVVQGIIAAMLKPERGAVYNLCSGVETDLDYVIELIENAMGGRVRRACAGVAAGDVSASLGCYKATTEALGYVPKVTIEDGIKRLCEWYKSNL